MYLKSLCSCLMRISSDDWFAFQLVHLALAPLSIWPLCSSARCQGQCALWSIFQPSPLLKPAAPDLSPRSRRDFLSPWPAQSEQHLNRRTPHSPVTVLQAGAMSGLAFFLYSHSSWANGFLVILSLNKIKSIKIKFRVVIRLVADHVHKQHTNMDG